MISIPRNLSCFPPLLPAVAVALAGLLVMSGVVTIVAAAQAPVTIQPAPGGSADATTPDTEYSRRIISHYKFPFAEGLPFRPSNATTTTGQFLNPADFPTAAYCGHCHQQAHAEWKQSAHANAFRNPWYTKNVNLLISTKGIEYTRHCEGCHNPIALVAGALTTGSKMARPFDADGVTCTVCHAIQKASVLGTGSYVLSRPAVLVDPDGKPIYGPVTDQQILAHLDRHSQAVMQDFYRTSEFCAVCHKASIPREVNHYKWQRPFTVYDEWQQSSFARQSPLPFYVKDKSYTCQTCHMQPSPLTLKDYGSEPGTFASHRWLGANTLMSRYYGYDDQLRKTIDFLRNGVLNVDVFAVERNAGRPVAPLGLADAHAAPGDDLVVSVVIQNKGAAHSLVPEQRDFYESWVEFTATDAAGHTLYHSGGLAADGALDPRAHSFTNRLINPDGQLNDLHQVWNTRVIAYNNTIDSGRSQIVRYGFRVPPATVGPITLTARVNYRRFNQHFIDFAMNDHTTMPVVEMARSTRTLSLGAPAHAAIGPADNPEWMRWNNYAIGLLDAQQYADSLHAFEHVVRLRPDYADGQTNLAVADYAWQRYPQAREALNRALALSPHNARAVYYLALVDRIQGKPDAAIADLLEVIARFPRSRDAHRELGFSFYQQHRYEEARAEYQTVQSIDPDDLSAHYILSIVYRRLGLNREAAHESAAFADQKDDPTAGVYALDFLSKHPEVTAESVRWHIHRDPSPTAQSAATQNEAAQNRLGPGLALASGPENRSGSQP